MSYQIRKSDGTLLIDLGVGLTDASKTSLTLIGKNVSEFGQSQNTNLVKLLENFASSTQPSNSLIGQTWFNKTTNQLYVKTPSGFSSIGPFAPLDYDSINFTTKSVENNSQALATTAFVHSVIPLGIIMLWSGQILDIPAGWALCNGQTVSGVVTPNLVDRFIMAAGGVYSPSSTGGRNKITEVVAHTHQLSATTGENSVTHVHTGVTNSAGVHNHSTNSAGVHNHGMPGDDQLSFANGYHGWTATGRGGFPYDARSERSGGGQVWNTTDEGSHSHTTVDAGSHNHTLTTGFESANHTHDLSGNTSGASGTSMAEVSVLNTFYALAYIMKVV